MDEQGRGVPGVREPTAHKSLEPPWHADRVTQDRKPQGQDRALAPRGPRRAWHAVFAEQTNTK